MEIQIIYIRDIKRKNLLPYERLASIKSWLAKNGVQWFGGKACKRSYVLKESFERAILQERINNLRQIYGDKWVAALKSEMQLKAKYQAVLDEIQNSKSVSANKQNKKIRGKAEEQFILDMTEKMKLR